MKFKWTDQYPIYGILHQAKDHHQFQLGQSLSTSVLRWQKTGLRQKPLLRHWAEYSAQENEERLILILPICSERLAMALLVINQNTEEKLSLICGVHLYLMKETDTPKVKSTKATKTHHWSQSQQGNPSQMHSKKKVKHQDSFRSISATKKAMVFQIKATERKRINRHLWRTPVLDKENGTDTAVSTDTEQEDCVNKNIPEVWNFKIANKQ